MPNSYSLKEKGGLRGGGEGVVGVVRGIGVTIFSKFQVSNSYCLGVNVL